MHVIYGTDSWSRCKMVKTERVRMRQAGWVTTFIFRVFSLYCCPGLFAKVTLASIACKRTFLLCYFSLNYHCLEKKIKTLTLGDINWILHSYVALVNMTFNYLVTKQSKTRKSRVYCEFAGKQMKYDLVRIQQLEDKPANYFLSLTGMDRLQFILYYSFKAFTGVSVFTSLSSLNTYLKS